MTFEKPILMLDEIIYPGCLRKILKSYTKGDKFLGMEFGKDCIRCICLTDDNQERLISTLKAFRSHFISELNKTKMIIFDEEEVKKEVKRIIEQIDNGISEKTFYDWFMFFAFQLSQNNLPMKNNSLEIKEGFLPIMKIEHYEIKNKKTNEVLFYQGYLWLSSNGYLLNPLTLSELRKKVEKKVDEIIKGNLKTPKKRKRNPLDSKLRHEVFKRDNYTCVECGATNKDKMLHCDHIIPVVQGGTDEMDNLQTLCDDCNLAKSDKCWIGDLNKGDNNGKKD